MHLSREIPNKYKEEKEQAKLEAQIRSQLNHPNVEKLIEFYELEAKCCLGNKCRI